MRLAPWMIAWGDIEGVVADGAVHYGFRRITVWGLWGGVAMMTTASLLAFFARPQIITSAFTTLLRRRPSERESDVLKDIELPTSVFVVGIPVLLMMAVLGIPRYRVFTIPGVVKIVKQKVPAKPARKGVPNPFKPGELMDVPAKPATSKVKVRALKNLKDMIKNA